MKQCRPDALTSGGLRAQSSPAHDCDGQLARSEIARSVEAMLEAPAALRRTVWSCSAVSLLMYVRLGVMMDQRAPHTVLPRRLRIITPAASLASLIIISVLRTSRALWWEERDECSGTPSDTHTIAGPCRVIIPLYLTFFSMAAAWSLADSIAPVS
jgi:hypothetical protein